MKPLIALALLLAACGGGSAPKSADTGTGTDTASDTASDTAQSVDTADTGSVESNPANRDGECVFNRDCPVDQRCGCTEEAGCACEDGPRGTGANGVDTCTDGNDCASALCVEGNDAFYCSDACETDDDCGPALPSCLYVTFLGKVCVREAG